MRFRIGKAASGQPFSVFQPRQDRADCAYPSPEAAMFQLNTLKVPVTDLGAAVAFYRDALGLTATFVAEEFGWAQMDGAGLPLALYVPGRGGGDRPPGGMLDFQLACADPAPLLTFFFNDSAYSEIYTNADGSRSLEFTDPDGNTWKVMAPAE